jgi:uncharacterized protein
MSKKIHTVQSSNKEEFDKEINLFLELGCELLDGTYEIINSDDGIIYSQVVKYENCQIEFHDNGKIFRFNGRLDKFYSTEIIWDKNGTKISSGRTRDDKISGVFFHGSFDDNSYSLNEYKVDEHLSEKWYKNFEDSDEGGGLVNYKKVYQRNWSSDRKHGYQFNSYENGQKEQEFYYDYGVKSGKWTWWYENGQKEQEENYDDKGKLNGTLTRWYENGQKKGEENYDDDKLNGSLTHWYEDGQIEYNITYKDGNKYECRKWYENGMEEYNHSHRNGGIDGSDYRRYDNGQVKEQRSYSKGVKIGTWIYYYEDGREEKKEIYENGEIIQIKDLK